MNLDTIGAATATETELLVRSWRFEQLLNLGYDPLDAAAVADDAGTYSIGRRHSWRVWSTT